VNWQMQTITDEAAQGGSRTEFSMLDATGAPVVVLSAWESPDCPCGSTTTMVVSADVRQGEQVRAYLNDDIVFEGRS